VGEVELGLVVDFELAALDGPAQVGLNRSRSAAFSFMEAA
jgi:hypothetical protein